jgi:tetratricopeptide (TPR) repeat protein
MAGTQSGMHCLECGATLPVDASRCSICGNEKLILPTRWTPPSGEHSRLSRMLRLGREARVLVASTLALICALWLLGSASTHSRAGLESEAGGVKIVPAQPGHTAEAVEEEVFPQQLDEGLPEARPDELRGAARDAEEKGAWTEALEAWTTIAGLPDAAVEDFLALAAVQGRLQDAASAAATLTRACVKFPDRAEGYIALGELYERSGNLNAARFQYQTGLGGCPDNTELKRGFDRVERALREEAAAGSEPPPREAPAQAPAVTSPPPQETPQAQPETQTAENTESPEDTPVTLLGRPSEEPGEVESPEATPITEILDFSVEATADQVTIQLATSSPAAFGSSAATDPPRLIVRIPDARLALSSLGRSVALNTPLVERVNLVESSTDSNVVILVIYLGGATRHAVAADARSLRVSVGRASAADGE